MPIFRNMTRVFVALGMVGFLAAMANAAILIGPGADIPGATSADSSGPRLNVETAYSMPLDMGTFNVTSFSFNSAGSGGVVVRPFLAQRVGNSPLQYETLWVGPQFNPIAAGIQGIANAYGTETFDLASATDVYAGVYHDGVAKVRYNNVATLTDHDASPTEPTYAGQTIENFSNAGLNNRTYAYGISVVVPEPATLLI